MGIRANHPTYRSWHSMISRCYDKRFGNYPYYGGRGISVCDRWRKSFENFISDMGPRQPGTTLDRIDSRADYTPENCRWSTPRMQARNRTNNVKLTYRDKTMTVSEWAEELAISDQTIYGRLRRKKPIDIVLSQCNHKYKKR